jgi:hypothetical protein
MAKTTIDLLGIKRWFGKNRPRIIFGRKGRRVSEGLIEFHNKDPYLLNLLKPSGNFTYHQF